MEKFLSVILIFILAEFLSNYLYEQRISEFRSNYIKVSLTIEKLHKKIKELIPLNRMAKKEEYRSSIQFLCSGPIK